MLGNKLFLYPIYLFLHIRGPSMAEAQQVQNIPGLPLSVDSIGSNYPLPLYSHDIQKEFSSFLIKYAVCSQKTLTDLKWTGF